MSSRTAAAFLDRDGTLIDDVAYIARPEDVRLIPGAAAAVARLNASNVPVIVVTNQSGIARGYFTFDGYERVRTRLDALLAAEGARIDASYLCPHHPDFSGPCECRKPGTLLYEQAATDLALDLSRSAFIGDRWRDVAPARAFGGRGILVAAPSTPAEDLARATRDAELMPSLGDAVEDLLGSYWRR